VAAFDQGYRTTGDNTGLAAGFAPGTSLLGVENILVDARLLRSERFAANTLSVSVIRIDGESRLPDQPHVDELAGTGDRFQPWAVRPRQEHGRSQGSADMHRGIAYHLIKFGVGLCAQDGLVGGAERREHLCQAAGRPLVALAGFFAVNVIETEREIFRHAGEKRNGGFIERIGLIEHNQQDTDAVVVADDGESGGGACAGCGCALVPGLQSFVVQDVIADARLLRAACNSDEAAAQGRRCGDGIVSGAKLGIVSGAGHDRQELCSGLTKQNDGGDDVSGTQRRFADLLKKLFF
jgi:hypothetical protein